MEISSQQSQSQRSAKFLNQTMLLDETTSTASVTKCTPVDMSIASNINKRNETISIDKAYVELAKSVKIRKLNEGQIESTYNSEPRDHNMTLQHAEMDSNDDDSRQNLDVTRMYDIDMEVMFADDSAHSQVCLKKWSSGN